MHICKHFPRYNGAWKPVQVSLLHISPNVPFFFFSFLCNFPFIISYSISSLNFLGKLLSNCMYFSTTTSEKKLRGFFVCVWVFLTKEGRIDLLNQLGWLHVKMQQKTKLSGAAKVDTFLSIFFPPLSAHQHFPWLQG